ncbi:uncharacterized protein MYCFIDRAFT_178050 [Pseudocercospora fijiensis CIRAD86]|uniref:Uncharacterized protein n=1 Tax=Pseudocercospora fijiensis (strain CIRAD86) TaxID=383855 RepID=M3A4C4_PSEFD|nr:uncharacterized protein MYCFIDRAFT_178050 [Pseudocercospora fijiensis CIRAD86]EME79466.1 hypothetical protein MYCFIDRAFT_178050 [Pseudocercospora fijiensis CIRAD86]
MKLPDLVLTDPQHHVCRKSLVLLVKACAVLSKRCISPVYHKFHIFDLLLVVCDRVVKKCLIAHRRTSIQACSSSGPEPKGREVSQLGWLQSYGKAERFHVHGAQHSVIQTMEYLYSSRTMGILAGIASLLLSICSSILQSQFDRTRHVWRFYPQAARPAFPSRLDFSLVVSGQDHKND